jgi:N-acetylmuramoyl-L-alanine amidase
MKIVSHRLYLDDGTPCRFVTSPNIGGVVLPELLVIHNTEGQTVEGAVATLTKRTEDPTKRKSAHLVIGRDGSIVQLVLFNRVAWHAGASAWKGRTRVNSFSVGIELDNAGPLAKAGKAWRAGFKRDYPEDDVVVAVHPGDAKHIEKGWHRYTERQLDVLLEVSRVLVASYPIRDMVGHDEISPGRKWDPGPAFNMSEFRQKLFGAMPVGPAAPAAPGHV